MKKLLGAALSLALVCGGMAPAQAELLKNLKLGGEVEVHAVKSNNLTDANDKAIDKDGRAHTRAIVYGTFDLNDDASAKVSLYKTNRDFGDNAGAAETVQDNSATAGDTGVLSKVWVGEANMTLKGVFGLDHMLGRQYYGNAGDLLVYYGPSRSPSIRTLPVTGVDALTAWGKWGDGDHMHGNVIIGKLTNTGYAAPTAETDTDLRGVELTCTKMEKAKLELRVLNTVTRTAGAGDDSLLFVSPRVSGKVEGIGYSAQYVMNSGESAVGCAPGKCKASGTAYLVGADYSLDFMGKLKLMAEFGSGSGDSVGTDTKDKAVRFVASDYRPGAIYGGNGGVLGLGLGGAGLTNLTTYNVGVWHDTEWNSKLGWGLKYYDFSQTKDVSATLKKHLGTEIDLDATWKHSDMVRISAGVGQFALDLSGSDPATQMYANFHVMF